MNPENIQILIGEIEEYLENSSLKHPMTANRLLVRCLIALETFDLAMATVTGSLLSTLCEDHLDLAEDDQGLIQFNSDLELMGELECPRCTEENLRALLDIIHQGPYDTPSLTESTEAAIAQVNYWWKTIK